MERAIEEAQARNARLIVAYPTDRSEDGLSTGHGFSSAKVEALERELEAAEVPHEVRVSPLGDGFAGAVLHTARVAGAGLIVLGIRRRSPVGKLVLGSSAQKILQDARCPVLAVKTAQGAEEPVTGP